ncbi:uncharacterized protein FOMMEDRAFT_83180 [Fomitiporia mediterranea MF3/22]|uniref:uncharacterized protein n=1 Tax=Fomitiporia mediterranea (strain MF3/22) TaxID=694068 RepID=UPI000440949D|nr:uncharacterized protein FOMMEDRAFT_83180 [Fomitiporia mediterranea MF3/22]EJD03822.1 hypothetical protein FOMMEDRAFT_83180 [Fomitiporia mediterranea MF3/22]
MSSKASETNNDDQSIGTRGVAGIPSKRQSRCGLVSNQKTRLHTLVALSIVVGILVIAFPRLPSLKSASRTSDELAQGLRSFDIPLSSSGIPSTYTTRLDYLSASAPPEHKTPDTTAVILNWSRLENVLLISALLCGPWLDGTIAEIFKPTGCPSRKLRIYNSPSNMLFQARYLACIEAKTPYCFTQDDDYLVQPEVIKNLHFYMSENPSSSSMHLLPAHEHLLSRLRIFINEDQSITTAFAWLGHGTYLSRTSAREFLSLLQELNVTNDEMKMADNYFTILANRPKMGEIWFDHGIELGGGLPFTVGSEGDDRNNRHIARALEYLSSLISGGHPAPQHNYVSKAASSKELARANFAPCRLNSCVLSSNIMLLSSEATAEFQGINSESVSRRKLQNLSADDRNRYIQHPLSSIVDARPNSAFSSPQRKVFLLTRHARRPF